MALRKCQAVLKAGAHVTVVAPEFQPALKELANTQPVTLIEDYFQPSHLSQVYLVIAATDVEAVNQTVFDLANERCIFANVVDDQPKCSFIFPAIVDRNPITIAISSAGKAPVLARRIREKLETLIPQHIGPLAQLVGKVRDKVKAKFSHFDARRDFYERVFDSAVVSQVANGQVEEAENTLTTLLESDAPMTGEVAIVGAGPGDPELLTIKALQAMQQADVIVYDYLVSEPIMELARRDAELICVGKKQGFHSVPQEQINAILVREAKLGKKVCRIKGGDPFIYGRGGEEVETLRDANIAYRIIPGITAAAGCSAYAGIPLTHRDHAQAIQFVTGHCKKDGQELDWASLAKANQTLAIYMGVIKSPHIQSQLIHHGRAASTPVAIIENGTRPEQRVVHCQLDTLADTIAEHHIVSPALLIIGEVAALGESLAWFNKANVTPSFAQPITELHTPLNTDN